MPDRDLAFARHFADPPDPRVLRTRKHALTDILVIALCAVVCGADSFEEIARFGRALRDWLGRFLALPTASPVTTPSTACSPRSTAASSPPGSAAG